MGPRKEGFCPVHKRTNFNQNSGHIVQVKVSRLQYAFFRKKTRNLFEMLNRKTNFLGVLDSLNSGNLRIQRRNYTLRQTLSTECLSNSGNFTKITGLTAIFTENTILSDIFSVFMRVFAKFLKNVLRTGQYIRQVFLQVTKKFMLLTSQFLPEVRVPLQSEK